MQSNEVSSHGSLEMNTDYVAIPQSTTDLT